MSRFRPNLRTLATELGLSVTTVSRALKDGPEVRPETRARVKDAAEKLGYVPDAGGVYLRTGRTMKVCSVLYTPEVSDYGDAGFLAQVECLAESLDASHYNLMVMAQTAAMAPLDPVRRVFDQRLADAVVFSRTTPMDERARFCLERDYPFVSFGRTELLTEHAFVDRDDEGAVYDATIRLAARGHSRIAFVNPRGELTYLGARARGYRRGLAQVGLPEDPALILQPDASLRRHRDAVADLLRRDRTVTAVIGSNQLAIVGILEGLMDAGCDSVRDGIAVVGFGGMPVHLLQEQQVLYYYQPQRQTGVELARHVLALLDGAPPETLRTVMTYRLIEDIAEFRRDLDRDSPAVG